LNGYTSASSYVGNIHIPGGRVCSIKKNTVTSVAASKETGVEVNTDKTDYMVKSQDQNGRLNHNITTDNSSFERVEQFLYLKNLKNQNSIQAEIKSRLQSGNACYQSVQNLLSSSLLSKRLNIRYTEL
jgi:hypothetical protein